MTGLSMATLGSGSSGNATLVRSPNTLILVDCGFTLKETLRRLEQLGIEPSMIDALVVTHEHGDHVKGIGPFARKFAVPVCMTHGTRRACRDRRFGKLKLFHPHEPFCIGDIELDPFPTPHDAAESCQFVFRHNGSSFALLTDLGVCTPHIQEKITGVNGILIESNYDIDMLRSGPYPYALQQRIRSDWGHLGNLQAGQVLACIDHPDLQQILLGHLSEQNNTEQAALNSVVQCLDSRGERVRVMKQNEVSEWFVLHSAGGKSADLQSRELSSA